MLDSLTLLAPGDTPERNTKSVVLTDARGYEAGLFTRVAEEVIAGPGIDCETSDAGPVFRVAHADRVEAHTQVDAHVLFFAATDTDVKMLAPVARRCRAATFIVHRDQDDSAFRALEAENLPHERNAPGGHVPRADAVLMGSDWSTARREFIRRCRRARIPTLSLQEAVNVDFDGWPCRMRWTDAVCISGPHALRYLTRDVSFLTGNPRFDGHTPTPKPAHGYVLINCNFILGAGGERGPAWMREVAEVVRGLGLDYRITKHPRDDTDLSGYEHVLASGAYKIRDQLTACRVLISRDSSLPYEALLTGRPVIYFDPFHEKERTLREDDSGLIRKCSSSEELRAVLSETLPVAELPKGNDATDDPYSFIFTEPGRGAGDRVICALRTMTRWPDLYKSNDTYEERGPWVPLHDFVDLRLRPGLRAIGPLRRVWRAARRMRSPQ